VDLVCKYDNTTQKHKCNGVLLAPEDLEIEPSLKDFYVFTCMDCHNTYAYHIERLPMEGRKP
jgi:hypothetical protein